MLRCAVPLAMVALAGLACADRTLTYRYELAGSAVGESRAVLKDDGTFSGATRVALGGEIASTFSGRTRGASVPTFSMELTTAGQSYRVRVEDGKGTLAVGTKAPSDLGRAATLPAKVAAFAPVFLRTLRPLARSAKGKELKTEAFLLDNFASAPITIAPSTTRVVEGATLEFATMKLGSVEMSVAWDEGGECVGFEVPAQKFRAVLEGFERAFLNPVDAYPELSRATFATERATVSVPVRDGIVLATEVVRPKSVDKVPTILVRTPYGRANDALAHGWYAARGYAVVVQDCRGRGASGGAWDPFVNEGRDGADTIAWIARQPWSDGKVGMIGGSYAGLVQWAAAVERPAALRCIVPQVSPPGSAMRNLPYVYGVPMLLANLWWLRIVEGRDADLSFYAKGFAGAKRLTTLPLTKTDDAVFGRNLPVWDRWLRRDAATKWDGWNYQARLAGVAIPTLHVSGYFDGDEIGTMLNWDTRREAGWTNQWLVYGPWPHGFNASTSFGGVDFGRGSQLELDSVYLRFFDTHLKGRAVGWSRQPKVTAFLTGANRWIMADSWPIPESREASLYLAGDGKARGVLLPAARRSDAPSRYVYDPRKAKVPASLSGERLDLEGSLTMKLTDLPGESLRFRTAPLPSALRVAGPISLEATIVTSARSTDLFALILDESPDGSLRMVGQAGAYRVGAKNDGDEPGTVAPNRPTQVRVRLWDFAHEFARGHRLTLVVYSDGFPMYARNLGTGDPVATGTRMVVQRNALYHDAKRPSRLRFRVLP